MFFSISRNAIAPECPVEFHVAFPETAKMLLTASEEQEADTSTEQVFGGIVVVVGTVVPGTVVVVLGFTVVVVLQLGQSLPVHLQSVSQLSPLPIVVTPLLHVHLM